MSNAPESPEEPQGEKRYADKEGPTPPGEKLRRNADQMPRFTRRDELMRQMQAAMQEIQL